MSRIPSRTPAPLRLTCWLALVLAACQSGVSPQTTPEPATPLPSATAGEARAPTPTRAPGCTVASLLPTPGLSGASPIPPIGEGDWRRGPADAAVTIIEYGDFQ